MDSSSQVKGAQICDTESVQRGCHWALHGLPQVHQENSEANGGDPLQVNYCCWWWWWWSMMILLPIFIYYILRCVISLDSQVCQKSPQILPDLERRSAHLHCYGSVRSGCYGWCQCYNHQKNQSIFFKFYFHINHVFTCRFQDIPRGSTSFGSNWGSSWSITRKKSKLDSNCLNFDQMSNGWSITQKQSKIRVCQMCNSDDH